MKQKLIIGPQPTNKELYERVKEKIYREHPKHSAYRSMMIVKEYKKEGGTYKGQKAEMNIDKWLGQKWSSINDYYHDNKIVKCGASDTKKKYNEYPICRPLAIIEDMTRDEMKKLIKEKNKLKEKHIDTSKVLGTKRHDIKTTKTGK